MVLNLQGLDREEGNAPKLMDGPRGYKIPLMAENVEISTPEDVIKGLSEEYRNEKRECFGAVMLSTKNRVLDDEVIGIGTLNSSVAHPREIFRPAIRISACSIILIHNHPSGDPEPSNEDIEIAERIEKAGKILGIEVLDFLIYGSDGYFSFREKGLIQRG
jgi:DNA repair protein RadC